VPTKRPVELAPVELAARLRLSAARLARRLRQESDLNLTPSQLSALASVERHGPVTLGRLAELERVAPPTITKVVAKLEADGLLARRVDGHDRRIARVSATPAALTVLAETRRRKDAWLAARIAGLGDAERERLAGALDVLEWLTAEASP
jgi:DNA-binding MarR family transcriptional regulator